MSFFKLLLPLDLQTFAADPTDPPAGDPTDPPGGDPTDPPAGDEPKFTQAELDRIVADRLAREKVKAQKEIDDAKAEAERKRLEENSEYKTLYETTQQQLDLVKAEQAAAQLAAKKQELIFAAGYTAEQLQDISALVIGNDEAQIAEALERVKKLVPVKTQHVDPTLGGGRQQTPPKTKDGYETARERARALLKRK